MNRYAALSILPVLFLAGATRRAHAEPGMLVNNCVAVVSEDVKRWSEGSILALNDKDILIAVTGYPGWNHDHSPV